jgi:hypothetical protein
MSDSKAGLRALARICLTIAATAMVATVATIGRAAWSQVPATPPASFQSAPAGAPGAQAAPYQTAPPAVARPENPGLFNEIGKLFDHRSSIFPDLPALKSPQQALDDFNAGSKQATDGLSRLTTPVIVRGRMVCPSAANGAPDCQAGSSRLCQSNGFKQGKSLDTDSAQACSAAALLSGGNRQPGNCRTNYYVTRALCE